MRLIWAGLTVLSLLGASDVVVAEDYEEANLEFFYPIVTRRPVIERELEFKLEQSKNREGRKTELSAAVEWPVLPRWQIELEVPLVINFPRDDATTGGPGDLEIENKFLLYRSVEDRILVSAGFTTTLPSGSEQKGLGGELALEPFATAAIALGAFDLIGELSYKWTFKPEHAQEFDTGLAAAWPVSRWFTPFVEFRTTTPTVAEDHRTQITLVPGLNVKPFPRSTLAVGVQLPVTSAREFDYQVRVLFIKEF
jgi:hypothetical protein